MDTLSDKHLFAMCLISALTGFIAYGAFGTDYGGGLILFIAIAVFAVLMFAYGYMETS
ncbi:hypothetical protein [Halostagnicola kamekurae]|uniref:Uncharacterized protein n=1 Tax=Halostagnicola kamekurae TaxID=619731 RepID=A0A1I6V892_9EURY|nr:hypothetical protein [Halostagnicola kamekurae]SFT09899.1 hypothetical protein SAMN04488556_0119 [Halostagnicola kamekurae]